MIPIEINLKDTFEEFNMTPQESFSLAEQVKKTLVLEVARQWDLKAKNNLKKSREQYRRALTIVDKGRFEGSVLLKGKFPNMVEQGASAFDMKKGFLDGARTEVSKEGKVYMTVPFRFGTPFSLGENTAFSNIMPPEVYDAIKKRKSLPQNLIPTPFDQVKTREKIVSKVNKKSVIFDSYTHKYSIFAGMKKESKFYENTQQSQYNTFRRVSEKSDKLAFIHPGLAPRKLAEQAIKDANISNLVDKTIDNFLVERGF